MVSNQWPGCAKVGESAGIPAGTGTWRSLAARLTGGQKVAGSNPVVPTILLGIRLWNVSASRYRGHMNRPAHQCTWSDEQLTAAVRSATSWRGVMRELGLESTSAGAIRFVRHRAEELVLDTSHFRGMRSWSDAQLSAAIASAKTWDDVTQQLGLSPNSGNIRPFLKSHAIRLGLDCGHLTIRSPVAPPERKRLAPDPELLNLRTAGTAMAAAWFAWCGCPISLPIEPTIFDLLVAMPTGIKRVQVKTTTASREYGWEVTVGRRLYSPKDFGSRAPYDPDDIDYFFIVDGDMNLYLIPGLVIAGRVRVLLSRYKHFIVGTAVGLMTDLSNTEMECRTS